MGFAYLRTVKISKATVFFSCGSRGFSWTCYQLLQFGMACHGKSPNSGQELVRESMQEFADAAVRRLEVANAPSDKAKTVSRIRAAFDARKPKVSASAAEALDALLAYWERLNALIQRQEHGALKEGERLTWADSRRVVFLLAMVFYELDAALE